MRDIKLYLLFALVCLVHGQGIGLAETMYVTDRLHLSLRSAPTLEKPSLALLASDTRVDVLETQGDWARVMLEDGRSGWVLRRFLVEDVPKSFIIDQLKKQSKKESAVSEGLRKENATLKKQIETLKNELSQQEVTAKEDTQSRLMEIYNPVLVAILVGLNIVYLLIIRSLVRRSERGR